MATAEAAAQLPRSMRLREHCGRSLWQAADLAGELRRLDRSLDNATSSLAAAVTGSGADRRVAASALPRRPGNAGLARSDLSGTVRPARQSDRPHLDAAVAHRASDAQPETGSQT